MKTRTLLVFLIVPNNLRAIDLKPISELPIDSAEKAKIEADKLFSKNFLHKCSMEIDS